MAVHVHVVLVTSVASSNSRDRAGMELDLLDARLDLEGAVKGKAVYPCGSSI